MERGEKVGLGVAGGGHLVLFGLLSIGFLATPNPMKLEQQPIEVSLVEDVGLQAAAPAAVEPPAQSIAPDAGPPEDAAPPAPVAVTPRMVPDLAPAPSQVKPAPAERMPKEAPAPKPVPVVKPKPAPAAPAVAKAAKPNKPVQVASARDTKAAPVAAKGSGAKPDSKAARPRGKRLGDDFLKGLGDQPSKSRSEAPPAAKIDGRALASIVQAIARQIQPCADRQVDPGPGANDIVTVLNLRLNDDGTLSATPKVVRQTGVNDENSRYARRVIDLGVAAFKGCSPLKLPPEYYSTPNGGWNNINYNWQLR